MRIAGAADPCVLGGVTQGALTPGLVVWFCASPTPQLPCAYTALSAFLTHCHHILNPTIVSFFSKN